GARATRRGRTAIPAPCRAPARTAVARWASVLAEPANPATHPPRQAGELPDGRAARSAAPPENALHDQRAAAAPGAEVRRVRGAAGDPRRGPGPRDGDRGTAGDARAVRPGRALTGGARGDRHPAPDR